jgi:cohesin loading factor subunit SCC2
MLPEWPAATILLRRLLKMLYSKHGLKHKDTAVKLAAVEFTGVLAARLCSEVLQAAKEAEGVQALLEAAEAAAGGVKSGWSGCRAWSWVVCKTYCEQETKFEDAGGVSCAAACCRMLKSRLV